MVYIIINPIIMYFTSEERTDGFGAQLQTLIHMIYYSAIHNGEYIHTPIRTIEHNYTSDPLYEKQLEELMCTRIFKQLDTFDGTGMREVLFITNKECRDLFETNVDMAMSHISLVNYKSIFWENMNNATICSLYNKGQFHIALHIRRGDVSPNYNEGRYTPNEYYLNKIEELSALYGDKEVLFHLYSEGDAIDFKCFQKENIILHLNEDIRSTFCGLVMSDVLVQSKSSFSYVAGLLSRGIVYSLPFWHPPLANWKQCV